jgi:galactokinase/mevalonate kinase-like predicted kinase
MGDRSWSSTRRPSWPSARPTSATRSCAARSSAWGSRAASRSRRPRICPRAPGSARRARSRSRCSTRCTPSRAARCRRRGSIEIEDLDEPVGKQDQYATAHGGLNVIRFFPDDSVDVTPVAITAASRRALEAALLLFYTGAQRSAGSVLAAQRHAIEHDRDKHAAVARMVELVHRGRALLEAGEIEPFCRLLDDGWQLKRSLTPHVSPPEVDRRYAAALAAGAWGGKLLGAGAGGFLLVAAPADARPAVRTALAGWRELPVRFERGGCKLVYLGDDPLPDPPG